MELLINGKYENVGFWSYMKCNILTQTMVVLILYGTVFILSLIAEALYKFL